MGELGSTPSITSNHIALERDDYGDNIINHITNNLSQPQKGSYRYGSKDIGSHPW